MKIAVTGLRGIPGIMGGVETHCEELLPRIHKLLPEAEITVFAREPYVGVDRYDYRGISVAAVASPRSVSLEAIVSTFHGILAARRTRTRIVHIHAIGPALLAPLARVLGMRVVMTHHGQDYNRAKWGRFARFALRAGERFGVMCAHRVIAVSPSLADGLRARFPGSARRIDYIPNGAPELPIAPGNILEELRLSPKGYLLAVGRLVPEKGLHDLIDAHALAKDPRPLVIVGGADHDSPYASALLARARDRVIFAGLRDRATLRTLYENASLFVMPSYHEGLPIAALEAASCATPMLLSDIQPNQDLGLPPSHYFPVGDVGQLAKRLAFPAESFSVDAAAFRTKFDWDEIAILTSRIYRALGESPN